MLNNNCFRSESSLVLLSVLQLKLCGLACVPFPIVSAKGFVMRTYRNDGLGSQC